MSASAEIHARHIPEFIAPWSVIKPFCDLKERNDGERENPFSPIVFYPNRISNTRPRVALEIFEEIFDERREIVSKGI